MHIQTVQSYNNTSLIAMQVSTEHKKVRLYDVSSEYQVFGKVGKGTYGTVFKAKSKTQKKYYAIKKFQINDPKLQAQGFPVTALRQVMLLKHINHPNIIGLKEILLSKPSQHNKLRGSTFLVLEYMQHDLAGLIGNRIEFSVPEIKCIMKQLLEGLGYLHNLKIMHRDIKPANILLNDKGQVKIADFGLGRKFIQNQRLTFKVVTLWYRAPELILKYRKYDHKIDMWSVGCMFAQFFTHQVMFKKQNDYAQLQRILEMVGDYKTNKVPKQVINNCQIYGQMIGQSDSNGQGPRTYESKLQSYMKSACPTITDDAIDLLSKLLDLNPLKRLSCQQALKHPFFTNQPLPCRKSQITKLQFECHDMLKNSNIRVQRQSEKIQKQNHRQYNKDNKDYHKPTYNKYNRNSRSHSSIKKNKDDSSKSKSVSDSSSFSSDEQQRSREKNKQRPTFDLQNKDKKDKYYLQNKQREKEKDYREKQQIKENKDKYRQKEKQREIQRSRQRQRQREHKYRERQNQRDKERDYYKNRQRQQDRDKYRDNRDRDRQRQREKQRYYQRQKDKYKQRNKSREKSIEKDRIRKYNRDNKQKVDIEQKFKQKNNSRDRDYKISRQDKIQFNFKDKRTSSPDKTYNKYNYTKYQKQDDKYKRYKEGDKKQDDRRANEFKQKDKQQREYEKTQIQVKFNKLQRLSQKYPRFQRSYTNREYVDRQRNQRGYRNQQKYQRSGKYDKYRDNKNNTTYDKKQYDKVDRYQKREQSRRYNRDENRSRYDRERQGDRQKRDDNKYRNSSHSQNKQHRSRSRDKKIKKQIDY